MYLENLVTRDDDLAIDGFICFLELKELKKRFNLRKETYNILMETLNNKKVMAFNFLLLIEYY